MIHNNDLLPGSHIEPARLPEITPEIRAMLSGLIESGNAIIEQRAQWRRRNPIAALWWRLKYRMGIVSAPAPLPASKN